MGELFNMASGWFRNNYPAISNGLLDSESAENEFLVELSEIVLQRYTKAYYEDPERLFRGLESVATLSFDFIRLQSRFMRKRKYRSSSAEEIAEQVYLNTRKMEETYLDGLFLTYAFWPNHTKILDFYLKCFIPGIPVDGHVMEIGIGHGLLAILAMEKMHSIQYKGLDLSPASVQFAGFMAERNGIVPGRLDLSILDATRGVRETTGYDSLVCSEVLEHVEAPGDLLANMRVLLKDEGTAFITTVANIEAEDHIYLFHDLAHIRSLLMESGFDILHELPLKLRGFEEADPLPLNYAAVLTKRK